VALLLVGWCPPWWLAPSQASRTGKTFASGEAFQRL
jgi:hypothetical protein